MVIFAGFLTGGYASLKTGLNTFFGIEDNITMQELQRSEMSRNILSKFIHGRMACKIFGKFGKI